MRESREWSALANASSESVLVVTVTLARADHRGSMILNGPAAGQGSGGPADPDETRPGTSPRGRFLGRPARRGDYRVLIRIDEPAHAVLVIHIGHWAEVYRPR